MFLKIMTQIFLNTYLCLKMLIDLVKTKQSGRCCKGDMKKTEIWATPIKLQGDKTGLLFVLKHSGEIKTKAGPDLRIKVFFMMVYEEHIEIVLEGICDSPSSIAVAHSPCPNNKLIIFTFLKFPHLDCLLTLICKSVAILSTGFHFHFHSLLQF